MADGERKPSDPSLVTRHQKGMVDGEWRMAKGLFVRKLLTEPAGVSGNSLQEDREGGRASLSLGREGDRTRKDVAPLGREGGKSN
jgi:hypothetical protein